MSKTIQPNARRFWFDFYAHHLWWRLGAPTEIDPWTFAFSLSKADKAAPEAGLDTLLGAVDQMQSDLVQTLLGLHHKEARLPREAMKWGFGYMNPNEQDERFATAACIMLAHLGCAERDEGSPEVRYRRSAFGELIWLKRQAARDNAHGYYGGLLERHLIAHPELHEHV